MKVYIYSFLCLNVKLGFPGYEIISQSKFHDDGFVWEGESDRVA